MTSSGPTAYSSALLGLHGLESEFKLAHLPFLVVDDVYGVVAFQGSSGTGKTTLVQRLGALNNAAGGGEYGIYSADKVQYEDFYGMPIPNIEKQRIDIIPLPHSIAKKEVLLIDELNRAAYENQEKFLSLFASRQIDGHKVDCKYMYVAMNPVMSKENESYEGTQPLDKALGERIMLLIDMPSFGQLSMEAKIKLITASNKQTKWKPSEELITLHKKFLTEARQAYETAKQEHMEKVAEYVCELESQLRHEKSGIRIEGRRAQFLLTNVLAIYALDKVFHGSANLKDSALQAVLRSFPNTLWYEQINPTALRTAHVESQHYLELDDSTRTKSFRNDGKVSRALTAIGEASRRNESMENISKLITNSWPDKQEDPAGHFIYAFGIVEGLKGRKDEQHVLKENEYKRFADACSALSETNVYKYYQKAQNTYFETGQLPTEYVRPSFIERSSDASATVEFDTTIKTPSDAVFFTIALMDKLPEIEADSYDDFIAIFHRTATTIKAFHGVGLQFPKGN